MDAQLQAQMQAPMSAQMQNHIASQMSSQLPPPRPLEGVNQEGGTAGYEPWKGDCPG